jgi:hypothetical protein
MHDFGFGTSDASRIGFSTFNAKDELSEEVQMD